MAPNQQLLTAYVLKFTLCCIFAGVNDGEQLVKALRDNQLWIRWGTVSNLPPLSHLYLHKHPPSYEVRQAKVAQV